MKVLGEMKIIAMLLAAVFLAYVSVIILPAGAGSGPGGDRLEPLRTERELRIPHDVDNPAAGNRTVIFVAESIPYMNDNGEMECIFRWRDANGEGKQSLTMKIEGLKYEEQFKIFLYFLGSIPLRHDYEEIRELCSQNVEYVRLVISDERGENAASLEVPIFGPIRNEPEKKVKKGICPREYCG